MPEQLRNSPPQPKTDHFLFHEMMAHPTLFTHAKPQTVAVIDNEDHILQEVLKHPSVLNVHWINNQTQHQLLDEDRITHQLLDSPQWFGQQAELYDVIIQANIAATCTTETLAHYFNALKNDGIFIESYAFSLLQLNELALAYRNIEAAGFKDWQLITFPQINKGMHVAIMASKDVVFRPVSEKNIFNRGFRTRYYNFDMHKAALALPEFVRLDLEGK